jgi:hypothetical protein
VLAWEGEVITLNIKGQIKSGKNHVQITRTGRRFPLKSFADWRDGVIDQILPQGPFVKIPPPLSIVIDYYPGDLIRRDAPGMIDALFHCFEKAGIVEDDAHFKAVLWREWPIHRENPRANVVIQALHVEAKA